jgi:signal transduction histidine kinase
MLISALFSLTIYNNVSSQIEDLVRQHNGRVRELQFRSLEGDFPLPLFESPPIISPEVLQKQKQQLAYSLFLINLGILVVAGGAGYFLSGRTLRPIKLMIDQQNQFISDASHELRTPIATLRAEMEAKLLEKHLTEKQARELIVSNLEELGTLQGLTDNLLKLTQVHTFNGDHKTETLSLLEIINTARRKVQPLAKLKSIDLMVKVPEAIVKGHKNQLTEVFVVLLDNAIKYSPNRSKILVEAENIDHKVRILVKDQGAGISTQDLSHVFERFYRADQSRSQVEGYGLGLSIAKKTITGHKGSIGATSKPGQGSTFEVVLPVLF